MAHGREFTGQQLGPTVFLIQRLLSLLRIVRHCLRKLHRFFAGSARLVPLDIESAGRRTEKGRGENGRGEESRGDPQARGSPARGNSLDWRTRKRRPACASVYATRSTHVIVENDD